MVSLREGMQLALQGSQQFSQAGQQIQKQRGLRTALSGLGEEDPEEFRGGQAGKVQALGLTAAGDIQAAQSLRVKPSLSFEGAYLQSMNKLSKFSAAGDDAGVEKERQFQVDLVKAKKSMDKVAQGVGISNYLRKLMDTIPGEKNIDVPTAFLARWAPPTELISEHGTASGGEKFLRGISGGLLGSDSETKTKNITQTMVDSFFNKKIGPKGESREEMMFQAGEKEYGGTEGWDPVVFRQSIAAFKSDLLRGGLQKNYKMPLSYSAGIEKKYKSHTQKAIQLKGSGPWIPAGKTVIHKETGIKFRSRGGYDKREDTWKPIDLTWEQKKLLKKKGYKIK